MGPKPESLWNDVSAPANAGTYASGNGSAGPKGSKGTSYKASQSLSSETGKDYGDKQGSHTSDQSVQAVGNGNVKKVASTTPGSEPSGGVEAWGGRGMGGY